MSMWLTLRKLNHVRLWAKYMSKIKERKLDQIFDEYPKSILLASLNQYSNNVQSHMAASLIPHVLVANMSPCIPGTDPLCVHNWPPCVLCGPTSLALCIKWLWLFLLHEYDGTNRQRQATLKPPWLDPRQSGTCYLMYVEVVEACSVENLKTLNDHYWCTRLGVEWLLCGPKMAEYKSGGPKGVLWLTGEVLFHTTCDHFWVP